MPIAFACAARLPRKGTPWDFVQAYADDGIAGTSMKRLAQFKRTVSEALDCINARVKKRIAMSLISAAFRSIDNQPFYCISGQVTNHAEYVKYPLAMLENEMKNH